MVLWESMSPQPVTMSAPAPHTVAAFIAFSYPVCTPACLASVERPGLSVGTPM